MNPYAPPAIDHSGPRISPRFEFIGLSRKTLLVSVATSIAIILLAWWILPRFTATTGGGVFGGTGGTFSNFIILHFRRRRIMEMPPVTSGAALCAGMASMQWNGTRNGDIFLTLDRLIFIPREGFRGKAGEEIVIPLADIRSVSRGPRSWLRGSQLKIDTTTHGELNISVGQRDRWIVHIEEVLSRPSIEATSID